MLNEIPQWKYERDFNYEEGVTTNEGYRYDLWNNSIDAPVLLNDKQLNHFLANGYLQLDTQLPSEFHKKLFEKFIFLEIGEVIGEKLSIAKFS